MTTQLVASRYRLDHSLGAGGSGRVWAGEDTVLERPVAIKAVELPPYMSEQDREILRTRVLREARAAARIDHPCSVRVFDVVDEGDTVHLVMELVSAPTLAEVGFVEPRRAAQMGLELLDALTAAHAADIVHRDVKPRNVMVLPDGHVKLADFGIATLKDDPRITTTGMVMGTPSYMSPEQARGEPATTACDIWGLGAALYYAVEGVSPFDRGEPLPTLNAVLHDEPRPPVRAGALGPVVLALLAKNPDARPTATEARKLLEEVAAGDVPTVAAVPLVDPDLADAAPATEVVERYEPEALAPPPPQPPPPTRVAPVAVAAPARGGRGWLVALGVVALVAALAAGGLALAGDDDDPGTEVAGTSTTTVPPDGQTTEPAAEPTETTETSVAAVDDEEDEGDEAPSVDVPDDWETYTDDTVGYTIAHPPGWQPQQGEGNQVNFVDPETGAYLRVDYTTSPGPDAVAGWREAEPSFANRVSGYERITIEPAEFGDHDAALWEYTYSGVHATNLAIVTADIGFALNFQAREEDWEEMQEIREAFEASFRLPGD